MKIEKKVYEQHPEGWFPLCIKSVEPIESEFKGKKTFRFLFKCESKERDTSGGRMILNVNTGRDLVNDPRCKFLQLIEACGLNPDDLEDTDELEGCVFAGKVQHGEGDKSGFASIVAFDTKDRIRAS